MFLFLIKNHFDIETCMATPYSQCTIEIKNHFDFHFVVCLLEYKEYLIKKDIFNKDLILMQRLEVLEEYPTKKY